MLTRHATGFATLICLAAGFSASARAAAETLTLELSASKYDRHNTPIVFPLPENVQKWTGFELTDATSGRAVAVQLDSGTPPRLVWILPDGLKAGDTRRYRLTQRPATSETLRTETAPAVQVRRDDRVVRIEVGGKPVLQYNQATVASVDPTEPAYGRSGFIHPVYDPSGAVVTDDMPPDHRHQHGLMFAWVDTTFEGRHVDFWNSGKHQGEVRHVELTETAGGPVFGLLAAKLDHVDLTAPGGPKVALHETWIVRVYRHHDDFLFDIQSTQSCAGESPLTINKYEYGGMAVRAAREWLGPGKCEFLTSEGKTRADGNHTRANWCDISGPLGDHTSGITIFCDPANFRAPQPVRLHPDKPYFCWAPLAFDSFSIEPGRPYVSRYRYHIHRGQPDVAATDALWNDFSEPPQVRVVEQ